MKTIGVILAGGASSRMGRDKATLSIEQTTMLARTREILGKTRVSEVVISRNDGAPEHIVDLQPGKGPLSGIHSVAMRYPGHNLLLVPVDLPLMNVATLQYLLDSGLEHRQNARYGEHSLPLFLQNDAIMRDTLDYTLRCTNSFSVDRFCSRFPLLKLELERQSFLYNTNTPEQWRLAMQHFSELAPSPI